VVERVDTAVAMTAALAAGAWDVVLADYAMPGFKAPDALQILHSSGQDLPFIIVSGAIQEEDAVTALRAGAHDFVVKDRLTRLGPAIARELRDAESRAARRREQAASQELESGYRLLFANSPLPMWMFDPQSLQFVEVNDAAIAIYGYSREEFLQMRISDIRPPEDVPALEADLAAHEGDFRLAQSWRHRWKDGSVREVEVAAHSLAIGGRALTLVVIHDVTERRRAESELAYERNLLRTVIDIVPDFIYAKDSAGRFTLTNRATAGSFGRTPEEVVGKTNFELHPLELAEQFLADEQSVLASGQPLVDREEMMYENGQERWQLTTTVPLRDSAGNVTGMAGISRNITQRRQHERELETVAAISAALRTAETLDDLLTRWLDQTLAAMNATGGSIWLYDPPTNMLQAALRRGWVQTAAPVLVKPHRTNEGVYGHVFTTRQPYLSADFASDPHVTQATRALLPPGGGAGIPIPVGNEVIGTFVVNTPMGHAVSAGEIHLLSTLAEIAGSAIQRMRYLDQMQQRLGQLDALRAIDQAITSSLDLNLTLTVFLDQVLAQLKVDAADVLLLGAGEQMLRYAAGRGFRTREFQQVRTRVGEGRAGRAVLERQIVVSDLTDMHPSSKRTGQLRAEGFVSYVGVPLIAKGQVLGVLEIFHRSPLQPAPDWMSFLAALAGQAALALDNAALFSGLQRSNSDLQLAYDATIEGWSRALDLRDKETAGHSQRVTRLTELLAAALGTPDDQMVQVRWGALLHDTPAYTAGAGRQDGRARPHPAQARPADRRRVGHHAPAPHVRL
jgi:PAS domain S-box-containing protein